MHCRELVSVAELSTSDRTAFVNALLALKAAPSKIAAAASAVTAGGGTPNRYDDYVWMHNTVSAFAHFGSAFGPWHREFLRQFEFDLRQVSGNPAIAIPYWDWTTGRVAGDPNWPFTDDLLGPLGDVMGLVTSGPFSNPATWRMNIRRTVFRGDNAATTPDDKVQLRRRPAGVSAGFNLPSAAAARSGAGNTNPYDAIPYNEVNQLNTATQAQINGWIIASFRKYLEWALHNGVHTWVGGQDNWPSGGAPTFVGGPMAFPPVAVNDPTFWLHHCNIDRLWTTWEQRHPPGTYVPVTGGDPGHNLNDQMRHFEAASAGNFNTPLLSHPADVLDSRGIDIWYQSDLPIITLLTSSVDFGDVPANLTTDWPVKFNVRTCRRVKFRLAGVAGANFAIPPGQGDVLSDHNDAHDPVRANVFVEFHALGTANVAQPGSAVVNAFIDDIEGYFTGTPGTEFQVGTWTIGLSARPVPEPHAAITLVLDRSGSMSEDAGPNGTKVDLLRSSLQVIGAILRDDDAIGIVSYDDVTATLTSPSVIQMGSVSPAGAGRQAVEAARTSSDLNPRNATAIGQGMIDGAAALQTVQSDPNYSTKAMVVMTDGNENSGPSVTSPQVQNAVAWFSNSVYAIGLGDETNVSATTLGAISRYQLITGQITSNEQRFLLTKYFLQILAQISNNAIIVDPQGDLRPGEEHRIQFPVGDSDVSFDAIVLCPIPWSLDFSLEAPDGTVIRPGASPNVGYQLDAKDTLYRVSLPAVPANAGGTHGGMWTAVLKIRDLSRGTAVVDARRFSAALEQGDLAAVGRKGALPYQFIVQAYSNLSMRVELDQDSYAPGATLTLYAEIDEYRVPLARKARIAVTITEPNGDDVQLILAELSPGRFRGTHVTGLQGLYQCTYRAGGLTRAGKRFQREEVRTAVVSRRLRPGSDGGYLSQDPSTCGHSDSHNICDLLACLLREPSILKLLKRQEVDPREIEQCVLRYCSDAGRREHLQGAQAHDHQEQPMNEDMRKVLREIEMLRQELKTSAPGSAQHLEHLLRAAPLVEARAAQESMPQMDMNMDMPGQGHGHGPQPGNMPDAHEDHHRHPLPFVIVDETGKPTRLVKPASELLMGQDPGLAPGATDAPDPSGHKAGAPAGRRLSGDSAKRGGPKKT